VKVALLGVGLIGGSIGLAARRRVGAHVVGLDADADALLRAKELGAIDESASHIGAVMDGADYAFVATPVRSVVDVANAALSCAAPGCVVSDVGSTKRHVVRELRDYPCFIGGHPLAGAETAGVGNAREDLFDGAVWYLTPPGEPGEPGESGGRWAARATEEPESGAGVSLTDAETSAVSLGRLAALVERLGAHPLAIGADSHDRLMASVSHLPHVFANVLVAQATRAAQTVWSGQVAGADGVLGAGPSFRDATRVAGANTAIWTDIYMSNRDLLADALDAAIEELSAVRETLAAADADGLGAWNERARVAREQLRRAGLVAGS
jgi:prephenate dehydrogenase